MTQSVSLAEQLDAELRQYVEQRRAYEEAEAHAKKLKAVSEEQKHRVWEMLEAAGVKTINHELGQITRMARLQVLVTDEEALGSWLADSGMLDAMTKRTFRQANLNDLVSERLEDGEELPPGTDTLTIRGIRYTPKR